MPTPYIGIDLGTTFSAIAYINEFGSPEIIENAEGDRTTPSVVLFDDDEVIVGSYAKDNMSVYPDQGVEFVKRFMGEGFFDFHYKTKSYSAPEISSFILKQLKQDAELKLGVPVTEAVITVPAYFGDPQRRATIEAGELAGLKVTQLINEPTAAAYAYGLHQLGKNQRVLVFDLGGGTFDVTIVEINGNNIEVKATNGDHQLGGKDWDEVLMQYIAEQFETEHGIDPYADEIDRQILKEKALATKISLSNLPQSNIIYGCKRKLSKLALSRERFEDLSSSLLDKCRLLTDFVLEESQYNTSDIDHILLTGGSTRMPMISSMLKEHFGKEPSRSLNPDESVALGAAIKAALLDKNKWQLSGEKKVWALPSKMEDINVTSHSFGLTVIKEGELFNSVIIPKNTPYPVEESRDDYVTSYDNQETLDIYVLEGEDEEPENCEMVGAYQIYDIPRRPAGKTRIHVTYRYNENQVVEVTAQDLQSNNILPLRNIENADLDQISTSQGLDIALLIDCSGSMYGDRLRDAQKAATSFLNNCNGGSVALITFPGGIKQSLTNDFYALNRKINSLNADGGTPMTEALDAAHQKVLHLDNGQERVIVLLTDGGPNNSTSAKSSADQAKRLGIRIISIGVSGADESFLKSISSLPSDFYYCNQSFELESTFINIATQLSGGKHLSSNN